MDSLLPLGTSVFSAGTDLTAPAARPVGPPQAGVATPVAPGPGSFVAVLETALRGSSSPHGGAVTGSSLLPGGEAPPTTVAGLGPDGPTTEAPGPTDERSEPTSPAEAQATPLEAAAAAEALALTLSTALATPTQPVMGTGPSTEGPAGQPGGAPEPIAGSPDAVAPGPLEPSPLLDQPAGSRPGSAWPEELAPAAASPGHRADPAPGAGRPRDEQGPSAGREPTPAPPAAIPPDTPETAPTLDTGAADDPVARPRSSPAAARPDPGPTLAPEQTDGYTSFSATAAAPRGDAPSGPTAGPAAHAPERAPGQTGWPVEPPTGGGPDRSASSGPASEPAAPLSPSFGAPAAVTSAPVGVADPPTATPEVTRPIAEQLAPALEQAISRPGRTVRLRLEPEGLGSVSLRVTLGEGGLSIHLALDNAAARDLVQASWPDLARGLAGRGLSVDQVRVELTGGQGSSGPGGQQPREPPAWSGQPPGPRAARLAEASVRGDDTRAGAHRIDYRV